MAGSVNEVVSLSTNANSFKLVVYHIGIARNSANLESDVKEGSTCTNGANSIDLIVSCFTDAFLVDVIHIGSTRTRWNRQRSNRNRGAGSRNTVVVVKRIALDTTA